MNDAIKLAIEKGGFTFGEFFRTSFEKGDMKWSFTDNNTVQIWSLVNVDITPSLSWKYSFNDIVLMLDFWQALGKALGNKEVMECDKPNCDSKLCEYAGYKDPKRMFDSYMECIWYGYSLEKFWKELLSDKSP